MVVNLKVPVEMNQARISLEVTWRDVLKAGIQHLQTIREESNPAKEQSIPVSELKPIFTAMTTQVIALNNLLKKES